MSTLGPALVVLAAGASSRLGEAKALARLRAGPGGRALEFLLRAGACLGDARPLVVTGLDHEPIAAAAPPGVELARNENWRAGRTGSVQLAQRLRPGRDLCLAPVDVPAVPGEVFAALRAEWMRRGCPARGWLAPRVRDETGERFGHPILVGRELLTELKEFPPDRPLVELRGRSGALLALTVTTPRILDDLDCPADLERLRACLRGAAGPDPGEGAHESPDGLQPEKPGKR